LGETMRELVLARVDPSVLGVGLYQHGVITHGWTPLPVRRSEPPPKPASVARPRRVPRPKAPAKKVPVPRGRRLGLPAGTLKPFSPVVAPGQLRSIKPKTVSAKPKPKAKPAKPKQRAVPAKPKPTAKPAKPKPKAIPRALQPARQGSPGPSSLGLSRKTPQAMSLQELRISVGMPAGLDQSGQRSFLKAKFDQLNSRMSSVGSSQVRREISHELMCVGQLRHRLR
jgi:hypothetical protein